MCRSKFGTGVVLWFNEDLGVVSASFFVLKHILVLSMVVFIHKAHGVLGRLIHNVLVLVLFLTVNKLTVNLTSKKH